MPPKRFRTRSRRLKTAIRKTRSKCSTTTSCTCTRSSTTPARLGPAALDAMSEDELIGWPARMPFLTFDEIDTLGEDEEDEEAVEEEDVK